MKKDSVRLVRTKIKLPTYAVGAPEKNPMFFEKRVYQGSCGKVYPVPFIDKVYDTKRTKTYDAVVLENRYVRLVMLPEFGGRIYLAQDKSNHDYDFFYRNAVIKPALVGLAGPWLSGGVEFNWPQHHRPGTFMPTDVAFTTESDGAKIAWFSEHDPLTRMKGMHGVCLRPDSARVELRGRIYNRTPFTRTFLWWSNVAARVHDKYESFFPPDVNYVADHAVRAMSSFPRATGPYYGVDYSKRPGADDLRWYKNIPVPTSYMICETKFDFFGGYDHAAEGGFVHVADRHVAPGKKQWTWGNHPFGYAWDHELTDSSGPYIELMAGVFTDNQPDFSYLMPYETKTFTESWWPYQKLGPVQQATNDAAIRCVVKDGMIELGVAVPVPARHAQIRVHAADSATAILKASAALAPDQPWTRTIPLPKGVDPGALVVEVGSEDPSFLVAYRAADAKGGERHRSVATEPPAPADVKSVDELDTVADHLELYRHPTRYPEAYWDEALRRDPGNVAAHIAYGRRELDRGRLDDAAAHFEAAIARLTSRNPNPSTGEAHYFLGLVRRFQGRTAEAVDAFAKARWNAAWAPAAERALAALRGRSVFPDKSAARAELAVDPLDHLAGLSAQSPAAFLAATRNDAQTILDLAYDLAEMGEGARAQKLLAAHLKAKVAPCATPNPLSRSLLVTYLLARLQQVSGDAAWKRTLAKARAAAPDFLFPSRLQDMLLLEWATRQPGPDRNAWYGLGNFYYDRKRHEDAIAAWEKARDLDPSFATAHRNLGIAYWNVRHDGAAARREYAAAFTCAPQDARVFAEFDQLREKLGDKPEDRLATLLAHRDLVDLRDDCSVQLAALFNATGRSTEALALLEARRFHPWEGGEGKVLRQYTAARLALGQQALTGGDSAAALGHFEKAMATPPNLGEAYHLLQAKADVEYWKGMALKALGRKDEAKTAFETAAAEAGDFRGMAVTAYSEVSYYRGLAMIELGRKEDAKAFFAGMRSFAEAELKRPAKIDYFATSLPLLLVFEDDLEAVKDANARRLLDFAGKGLAALA